LALSLRSPLETRAFSEAAQSAADAPDPESDFRSRAEQLLAKASSVEDAAARAELVIKAATLHHLALLREAGRQALPLSEPASFAKSKVEAQVLGQGGERRGLKGGPPTLRQAQAAYGASDASAENAQSVHPRRTL
jgi:hypothetical protein